MTRKTQSNFFPRQGHPLCELRGAPHSIIKQRYPTFTPPKSLKKYYSSLRRTNKYSPPLLQQADNDMWRTNTITVTRYVGQKTKWHAGMGR